MAGKIYGFVGTQHGLSLGQRKALSKYLAAATVKRVIHGAGVGADAEVHVLCGFFRLTTCLRPSDLPGETDPSCKPLGNRAWSAPPQSHLHRNRQIVRECDVLIVCPGEMREVPQVVTIRAARKRAARDKSFRYVVINPDGRVIEDERGTYPEIPF